MPAPDATLASRVQAMIDDDAPDDPALERRNEKDDRRNQDRRAHERYTLADVIRADRRQGERRRDSD